MISCLALLSGDTAEGVGVYGVYLDQGADKQTNTSSTSLSYEHPNVSQADGGRIIRSARPSHISTLSPLIRLLVFPFVRLLVSIIECLCLISALARGQRGPRPRPRPQRRAELLPIRLNAGDEHECPTPPTETPLKPPEGSPNPKTTAPVFDVPAPRRGERSRCSATTTLLMPLSS